MELVLRRGVAKLSPDEDPPEMVDDESDFLTAGLAALPPPALSSLPDVCFFACPNSTFRQREAKFSEHTVSPRL